MVKRRRDRMRQREERHRARHDGIARPEGVADDAVLRVLRVPAELAGTRLDRFLQLQLRATSRNRSQRIIEHSAYAPDGQPLKKNHRLAAGERVALWRPPWDEEGADATLAVVHEDEALLAINKPPFIVVHPTARHNRATVQKLLERQRPDDQLTLVHRIDRETSGVLLLARTRAADRAVKIQLEERRDVIKRYVAITWGAPRWDRITCEAPLELDATAKYRVKMRCAAPGSGQPSATTFEVLDRLAGYAKIGCTLHTGRQHQIRVHLAALGFPVLGDKLYGPDEELFARGADGTLTEDDLRVLEHDRQALHASELTIDHPLTGERLTITAPLYDDLVALWTRLSAAG